MTAVPPVLLLRGESNGVERQNGRLFDFAIADQLNTVRWTALSRDIWDESRANASPAWLLTTPLETTAGPRQLFTVKKATAGANDAIPKLASWTMQN